MRPEDTAIRLSAPLFISGRLMAAVNVGDDGGTLHIAPIHRDREGRVVWRYVIEDGHRSVLDEGADLRSGADDPVDPRKAMASLVSYLGAAADEYRTSMSPEAAEDGGVNEASADGELFPPNVMEWAYMYSDELASVGLDLEEPHPWLKVEATEPELEGAYADGAPPPQVRPFRRPAGAGPVPAGWAMQPVGEWNGQATEVVYDPRRYDVMVVPSSETEDREGELANAGWRYEGTDGYAVMWVRDRVAAARAALDRVAKPPARHIGSQTPEIGGLQI